MPWWYSVVEAKHELQNPTSAGKIQLLGERLGLGATTRVLDVGAGRGGPAILLARAFGCRITCIERAEDFADAARARIQAAGVSDLVEVSTADAAQYDAEPSSYDAALCLGATFIYGGLEPTIKALRRSVRPGGLIAVGEPYWREWPLPQGIELDAGEDVVSLAETVERAEAAGVSIVGLIAASEDDWDRYESLHWQTLDEWLSLNRDHPQAEEFRETGRAYRDRYVNWRRNLLGWAMFICRT